MVISREEFFAKAEEAFEAFVRADATNAYLQTFQYGRLGQWGTIADNTLRFGDRSLQFEDASPWRPRGAVVSPILFQGRNSEGARIEYRAELSLLTEDRPEIHLSAIILREHEGKVYAMRRISLNPTLICLKDRDLNDDLDKVTQFHTYFWNLHLYFQRISFQPFQRIEIDKDAFPDMHFERVPSYLLQAIRNEFSSEFDWEDEEKGPSQYAKREILYKFMGKEEYLPQYPEDSEWIIVRTELEELMVRRMVRRIRWVLDQTGSPPSEVEMAVLSRELAAYMAYKAPSTRKGDYSSNIYRLLTRKGDYSSNLYRLHSDHYFYSNAQRHRFTWRAMSQGYYTPENRTLLEEVTSTSVNLLPYLMKALVDLRGRYLHKDLPKTIELGFRSGDWDLCKVIYTVNHFAPLLQKAYWESLVQQLSQAIQEQRGRETIMDLLSRIDYYTFLTGVEDPLYQLSRMDLNFLPWILEDLLHRKVGLYTAFSSFMKNSPQWFTEECHSTLHDLSRKGYATLARNLYKEVTRYAPQQIREEDHEFFHDVLTEYDTLHSLNEEGKHHLEEKQIGPAIECFQKVMEMDPYFFCAVFNLGLSLQLGGNNYGAFIYFKMVLSLLPEDLKRQVQSASELIYTAGTLYDEKLPPGYTVDDPEDIIPSLYL